MMSDAKFRPVQVHDSRGRPVPGLFRRGEGLYMIRRILRKRYVRAIPETTLEGARRWMRGFEADRRAGVPEREELRARRSEVPATIGEVCGAYLDHVARFGAPAPSTARLNVTRLRRLVAIGAGRPLEEVDGLEVSVLSAELVQRWAGIALGAEPDDSRRRSVRSLLRQARSLWARDVLRADAYRDLTVPDLAGFLKAVPCKDPAVQYRMPEAGFVEWFLKRAHKLGEEHDGTDPDAGGRPDLYGAFLLMFYSAGRPGDACAARWSWLFEEDLGGGVKRWAIDYTAKPAEGYKPKASGGCVPLPAAAVAELRKLERAGDPYILPGGSATGRRDLICRDLAGWMRLQGWETEKAGYELRKLRGCYWRLKYGLDRCHTWMRHKSYNTTLRHYADLPRRPLPADLEVGFELDPHGGRRD
jgi:integrase